MDLNEAKKTIRDLLNLANDDAAAELEVENALHFARRLMLRSNLTEEQCQEEKPKSIHERAADEEYGLRDMFSSGAKLSSWECDLLHAISALVGSVKWYYTKKVVRRTAHGTLAFAKNGQVQRAAQIHFYGPLADIAAAVDLAETWATTVAAMARMKYGGCFRGPGRNYAEGFAHSLGEKVRKIEKDECSLAHEEAAALGGGCTALALTEAKELMVAKRKHAVNWLKESKGISLRKGSSRGYGSYDDDAWNAGRSDGTRADFSQGSARKAIG